MSTPTPIPYLPLTEHQQWSLISAAEIEELGWIAAANALRRKHFPYLSWDDPARPHGVATAKGFEAMLRLHHSSTPPMDSFARVAPQPAVHHGSPPTPQVTTPAARPDQPIA